MKEGIIFSIEEFAIHDGPGIRTTVFLKGCPLRCEWCHNPEGISFEPQNMVKNGESTICGERISSTALAKIIMKNKDFFELNGGGVTLTGGEPLAQASFVIDFLKQVDTIHKVIETSGQVPMPVFKEVVSLVDLVLIDIKHMNSEIHKKYTGVRNELIQNNIKYLISSGKEFIVRVPLIPGVNDSEENMLKILSLVKDAKSLVRVELMPYHKTAGAKHKMIGKTYSPSFDPTVPPNIYNVFEENNIKNLVL
ncbi:radical SAM protein [Sunxiuqinia sp. A32]|uniref:radical SAM protein n=1 Tax=Sunxiuqinia sp. A32 TaxID=3461496 RepID=UPI004046235A